MGEYSKRVGEVGESVVADLLRLLGWQNIMRNEDIDSIDTDFRKTRQNNRISTLPLPAGTSCRGKVVLKCVFSHLVFN